MIIHGRGGLGTHCSKAVSYMYVCECGMCEQFVYSACVIECEYVCMHAHCIYVSMLCVSHVYAVHV